MVLNIRQGGCPVIRCIPERGSAMRKWIFENAKGWKRMLCPCVATIPHEAAQWEIFLSPIFVRFCAHTFRIIILGLLRSSFCPPFPSPRTESSPSIVFIYRGSKQWILFACIIDGTILLFRVSGSIWYEFLDHVDRYQFWITFGSGFKIDLC